MAADIFRLFDPELIIPSPSSVGSLAFWKRLDERADDKDPRVGPTTMQALHALMSNLPRVSGLPTGDMWSILGKIVNRGYTAKQTERSLCREHFSSTYTPVLGLDSNALTLMSDAAATGAGTVIALTTVDECWSEPLDCAACQAARFFNVTRSTASRQDLAAAWRQSVLTEFPEDIDAVQANTERLFPNLRFAGRAWADVNTLRGDHRDVFDALVLHLSALNDHAQDIWRTFTETSDREAAFGSLGVTSSPESPKTRRDSAAMKERDFVFDGRTIRCEWHTKFRPDVNRIHFFVTDEVVYVGTIIDHLSI